VGDHRREINGPRGGPRSERMGPYLVGRANISERKHLRWIWYAVVSVPEDLNEDGRGRVH